MAGSSVPLCPNLTLTNVTPSASRATDGSYDKAKETVVDVRINNDIAAGVGCVVYTATPGASQVFTSVAAAWIAHRFGNTTGPGFLQKANGAAFAVSGLPAATTSYAGLIAVCSDGVRICKYDGSAWQQLSVAN